MSQIKSYLSIESVPSYQFITPVKNIIQNIPTNNSMAFSQSLGTNDSKSNSYRNCFRSNEVFREFNYQLRDQVQQQSEEMINNNSSITLHPRISKNDINELICHTKMILFFAGECEQKRQLIINKKKALMTLQKGISMVEERIEQNQSIFMSKEKSIKSRSLSIQKQTVKKSKRLMNEIVDMKLDIKKMERTLSSKKQTIRSSGKKEDRYLFQTERRRKPIYIPVMNSDRPINPYANYNYTSPQPFFGQFSMHQQHPFAQSMQPQYFRNEAHRNSSLILSNSLNYSDQNQLKNSLKKPPINNEDKFSGTPSASINSNPILNMLKSKLSGPQGSAMFQGPSIRTEIQRNYNDRNPEVYSNRKATSIKSNSSYSKQNSKIKINILPEAPPNLDYLNYNCDEFSDQILMNSNNGRKIERSIKQLKMSVKSSKWKNDEDVEADRELLKSLTSIKTLEHLTGDHPRSSMGAKIVQTHLKAEQDNVSFDLPEKSHEEPSHQRSQNKSKIQVLFQNSSDKRNDSNSNDCTPKSPNKSHQRQFILNSQVGIILHDVSDYEESPNKAEPRSNPSRMNNLLKEFPKIQEIDDDGYSRANTPNDFSVFNKGFQPVRDSKLSYSKEEAILQASCPTDKAQSQKSPLSQPPSLVEQEDDMIDSIQLATNSRYSTSSLKKESSMINKASAISRNQQEDDGDFLGGFKLATMSRVSRERIADSTPEKLEIQQDFLDILQNDSLMVSKIKKKMTQSNLDEVKASEEKDELDDAIGSNIRNSSTSVIVKKNKNSAIQRSVGHIEKSSKKDSNIKSSLRGSYLSGQLSTPIAEAEEEEQQYSHIIKKHKRSETDFHH